MQSNSTLIAGEMERAAGLASLSPGVSATVRTLSLCPNARLVCACWPPTLISPGPQGQQLWGSLSSATPSVTAKWAVCDGANHQGSGDISHRAPGVKWESSEWASLPGTPICPPQTLQTSWGLRKRLRKSLCIQSHDLLFKAAGRAFVDPSPR